MSRVYFLPSEWAIRPLVHEASHASIKTGHEVESGNPSLVALFEACGSAFIFALGA